MPTQHDQPERYGGDPAAMALAVSIPLTFVVGRLAVIHRFQSWDSQQVVNGIVNLVGGLTSSPMTCGATR